MKHRFPHDLDLDLARRATTRALESYVERFADYRPRMTWIDDARAEVQFEALGMTLKGIFELTPDAVLMEMRVPLLLRAIRGRAVAVVEAQITEWIARAKRGELDDTHEEG